MKVASKMKEPGEIEEQQASLETQTKAALKVL